MRDVKGHKFNLHHKELHFKASVGENFIFFQGTYTEVLEHIKYQQRKNMFVVHNKPGSLNCYIIRSQRFVKSEDMNV